MVEFIAVSLVIWTPLLVFWAVAPNFGKWVGFATAFLATVMSVMAVVAFYRADSRWRERERQELLKRYPCIYRVLSLSTDSNIVVKAEGTTVAIGDYGWEAEPIQADGLTYLHGLTNSWEVAWYAGFAPDQIERIGPKPRLQYYLPYSWICAGGQPPACPFPVVAPPAKTLGHPCPIIDRWVQGRYVPVRGAII